MLQKESYSSHRLFKTMKETPSSPQSHATTEPRTETRSPTTESSGGRITSTANATSLLNTPTKTTTTTTQTRAAKELTVTDLSPGANETASVKQEAQCSPVPTTSVTAASGTTYKTGTVCPNVHRSLSNASGPAQFFYEPKERSCIAATALRAHVCNRSSNQFASMDDCLAACVKGRRAPENRCVQKPCFVACTAADARSAWCFHDGRKFVPWTFVSGRCPLTFASFFDIATVCDAQCNDSRSRKQRGC